MRMSKIGLVMILLIGSCFTYIYAQAVVYDTLTVMTYNVEYFKYPESDTTIKYFKKVIQKIKPDIACFQEIKNDYSGKIFLYKVIENLDVYDYVKINEDRVLDSYNLLIYNISKLKFLYENIINTESRDINAYYLRVENHVNQDTIVVFSSHLKAGGGEEQKEQRYREIKNFQKYVSKLDKDYPIIFAGDLNVYTSREKAYQVLIDSISIDLDDPLNKPGDWHENPNFSFLHTQATRANFSGLDDRFDFILMSYHFFDGKDIEYVRGSYKAFGNDGKHLNKSINDPIPSGLDKEIADALYNASDHLPVVARISYPAVNVGILSEPICPGNYEISLNIYPNPFNNSTNVHIITGSMRKHILSLFDLRGVKIFEKEFYPSSRENKFGIDAGKYGMTTGIYFVRVSNEKYTTVRKLLLIK